MLNRDPPHNKEHIITEALCCSVTMNAKPSYSSLPAASSGSLITSVNHNDVFMGRGTESNDYIGNQKFRSIVEPHKREYKLIPVHDNKAKEEVARKILNHIML